MDKKQLLRSFFVLTVLIMSCVHLSAAPITVNGTVTDGKSPLAGVTVLVKGTQHGTATDAKGAFSISVPDAKATLVFSYIGYQTREMSVGAQKTINVILSEETNLLDELVVVGYGVQQKSHLTGSIAKIDGNSLIDMPLSDVTQALQGKVTGLSINNTTSEVGVSPEIRVRGIGSVSANSSPLVIVDGYPVPDGLSMVNSADIASIEILKDAASAAIYGSRAANGVIMITTKSGNVSAPKYSVKFYSGIKYAYKLHDLMTATEYLDMLNYEASQGSMSSKPGDRVTSADRAGAWIEQNVGTTDWQREGLRDAASITNVQLSVSGGKKEAKYYVSGAYTKDEGLMKENEVQKVNFRAKMDNQLSKFVTMGVNVSGTYTQGTRPVNNYIDFYRTPSFMPVRHNDFTTGLTGYTGYTRGSHFRGLTVPTGGYDEFGNPIFETLKDTAGPYTSANNNPVTVMNRTGRGSESFQSVGNIYLNIQLAKGLTFKTSNGYNVKYAPDWSFRMKDATKDGEAALGEYNNSLYVDLLTENTLNYALKIKKHDISVMAGYTLQKTRTDRTVLSASGFPTDKIETLNAATVYNLLNRSGAKTGTFKDPDRVLESYLARVTYSYADKYLLSGTIRLDRSSLFAAGHRNAYFPSVSVGWRVSEEDFMKHISWISSLKLRGSYGVTGNNDISYNAYLNIVNDANYPLGPGNGSVVPGLTVTSNTMGNPLLTWEQTDEFNVGLDFSVLSNRINLAIDAYHSTTRALLFKQPVQSITGFESTWNNIGRVRNQGLEIAIDSYNIRKKNFEWNTSVNFSTNRNKFLEVGNETQIINSGERSEQYLSRVGYPVTQFYGFKAIGVWDAEQLADPKNARFTTITEIPGKVRVLDADKNGYIDDNDRVALGNPYPDFTWGMTNTFRYKNFDLSILIQGVQGVDVLNGDGNYVESQKWNTKYNKNRWISETNKGDGKTPTYQGSASNTVSLMLTDMFIEDASYVALRNVTLGYTFSKNVTKKIHISNLRLYASGNNLLYLWSKNYRGINPESRTNSGEANPLISGYQRGGFPLTSTITFGLDFSF